VAGMMKELNNLLGIQTKLSIAYHPQTNRQMDKPGVRAVSKGLHQLQTKTVARLVRNGGICIQ